MATGSSANPNAYYLSAKVKDCDPHFSIQQSQDGEFVEINTDEWVEGYIKKIVIGTYVYEGDTMPKFTVFLIDGESTYIISFTYTMPSRNIINTLLSIEKPGLIRFVLSKDKNDYATAFVSNNFKFATWKYKWGDFKDHIIKSKGSRGSVRNDYTDLDKFFEEELKQWIAEKEQYFVDVAPHIAPTKSAPETLGQPKEEAPMPDSEDTSQEGGLVPPDDDLPF